MGFGSGVGTVGSARPTAPSARSSTEVCLNQPMSNPVRDGANVPVSIHQCPPPVGAVQEEAYHAAVAAEDALRAALAVSSGNTTAHDALQAAETKAIGSLLAYHDLLQQRA